MRIGFTNGCFDILHPGHIHLLNTLKQHCHWLIVGINSDESVKRLKGKTRPINNEYKRQAQLQALPIVNEVLIFTEDSPLNLIRQINPDVLAKGGDYSKDQIIGADYVERYGGKVLIVPLLESFSTTNMIRALRIH